MRCRPGFRILWFGALLAVLGNGAAASAQLDTPTQPAASLSGELQSLASRAATVFAGQVVSIARHGGVVEIEFRVEQPVLGSPGASYVLREWAGLWPPGQFRYYVGERALIFLQGASAAGFASPVDGAEGVVPVVVQGANQPELVDVRRLSAAVLRPVGTPLATAAQGAIQLTDAIQIVTASQLGQGRAPAHVIEPVRLPLPVHVAPVREPGLTWEAPAAPLSKSARAVPAASVLETPDAIR